MSAIKYYGRISEVLANIHATQGEKIEQAGEAMAAAIAAGKRVYLYGSGHSVIPVMDIFPRYGSFVGFFPLYDPRLMWSNVVGPNGARELLWLERKEGYAEVFLQSYPLDLGDVMIVFSHGGMNAAPIEAALYAKKKGLTVVTVSSLANAKVAQATHSSGKKLPDVADIAIDNCVASEDSQVDIGRPEKVAAGSTMAVIFVAMSLVAETGARLVAKGHTPVTFVSPNVAAIERDHNQKVFQTFSRALFSRGGE
jgi:uncharacterized phosphosugar-binding protein